MARKQSTAEKRYLSALESSKKRLATLRKEIKNPTKQLATIGGGVAYRAIQVYSPMKQVGGIDMALVAGLAGFAYGMSGRGKMQSTALDVSTGILTVSAYKYSSTFLEG